MKSTMLGVTVKDCNKRQYEELLENRERLKECIRNEYGVHPDSIDHHRIEELEQNLDRIQMTIDDYERNWNMENNKPDMVNHPPHYNREGAMECIDEMIMVFGKEAVAHYCLCNAWKYRYRSGDKDGLKDMMKSDWYMREYKELHAQIDEEKR